MNHMEAYRTLLFSEEKSELTIEKYLRDAGAFLLWQGERPLSKELVLEYKAYLTEQYAVASVNSMLSAVNNYLTFLGRQDCRVKILRRQRQIFRAEEKELTREEYRRLLRAAEGNPRLQQLQTICATGIRVSEHRFITVEAAKTGVAEVRCKGKLRTVLLPKKLCSALLKYAKKQGIRQGTGVPSLRILRFVSGMCIAKEVPTLYHESNKMPRKAEEESPCGIRLRNFWKIKSFGLRLQSWQKRRNWILRTATASLHWTSGARPCASITAAPMTSCGSWAAKS